ncbi:MAG: transglutaminase domain-containing protein [Bacteroidota bacterium]|nr:transglutaminase domain-containing protein [Bacteroidota bacterium]
MISKYKIYFTIAFLFASFLSFAQPDDLKKVDYTLADKIATEFPKKKKYKTVSDIAGPLTENLKTEHEKFRAIFRWITENIEYNKSAANAADADKVIRKNKAVCQGFSNLLKEMCESVKIPCEMVVGYTKTDVKDINRKLKKTDHAWNIVTLYNKKYLVDVTWATSKFNVNTRKFEKAFDEHYFLTPPEKFILDHLPENKKDQLLEKPLSKKRFSSTPLLYADYFHVGIGDIFPNKGKLKQRQSEPFVFKFNCTGEFPINEASILADNDKYFTPVKLTKSITPGFTHEFLYTFEKEGDHDLTIFLNGKPIVEYLIKVK